MFENRIDTSDVLSMDFDDSDVERYELHNGDILLNEGQSPEWLGRSAIFRGEVRGACFQNTLLRFQPDKRVTIPEFAQYLFRYYMHSGKFLPHSQWTTNIAHLGLSRFAAMPFPLPPLDEQHHIVEDLDHAFSLLEAGEQVVRDTRAKLVGYRAAVLRAACEGRLVQTEAERASLEHRDYEPGSAVTKRAREERAQHDRPSRIAEPQPPEFYEGLSPPLPEGWVTAKVEELVTFVTSGSRGWARHYSDLGDLFLRVGNLDRQTITLDLAEVQRVSPPADAEGTRTKVQDRDILISITADVGMIGLVTREIPRAYINQHVSLARPTAAVNERYLAWFLATPTGGQRQYEKLRRGVTKAGLGLDDIQGVLVPVPPIAEQCRIVAEVERRLSVVERLEGAIDANLARAKRLREAILKRAFEGRLVPQDPSDEPASVLLERIRKEKERAPARRARTKKV